jgi:hypothetical protein
MVRKPKASPHFDSIALSEFASRRLRLRAALKHSVGLVFAGDHDNTATRPFGRIGTFSISPVLMMSPERCC